MEKADKLGARNLIVWLKGHLGRTPIFFLCRHDMKKSKKDGDDEFRRLRLIRSLIKDTKPTKMVKNVT